MNISNLTLQALEGSVVTVFLPHGHQAMGILNLDHSSQGSVEMMDDGRPRRVYFRTDDVVAVQTW